MFNKTVHPIVPLLQLIQVLGRIDGRKKLQKITHILQARGVPLPERFQYAFYGMYSQQLRSEIERLQAETLVTESPVVYGTNVSYILEKTDTLETLMTELEQTDEPAWAEAARHLNSLSPQQLEGISTILFLKGGGSLDADLRQRVLGLKPHLDSVYDQCAREADSLPRFDTD